MANRTCPIAGYMDIIEIRDGEGDIAPIRWSLLYGWMSRYWTYTGYCVNQSYELETQSDEAYEYYIGSRIWGVERNSDSGGVGGNSLYFITVDATITYTDGSTETKQMRKYKPWSPNQNPDWHPYSTYGSCIVGEDHIGIVRTEKAIRKIECTVTHNYTRDGWSFHDDGIGQDGYKDRIRNAKSNYFVDDFVGDRFDIISIMPNNFGHMTERLGPARLSGVFIEGYLPHEGAISAYQLNQVLAHPSYTQRVSMNDEDVRILGGKTQSESLISFEDLRGRRPSGGFVGSTWDSGVDINPNYDTGGEEGGGGSDGAESGSNPWEDNESGEGGYLPDTETPDPASNF